MSNGIRKRSRPNADLTPIHVSELLNGAGMTGFLSVLRIPGLTSHASAAQRRVEGAPALRHANGRAQELLAWLSARTATLLEQADCQQDALLALEAAAGRMNRAVQRLHCETEFFKASGWGRFHQPGARWKGSVPR
jgi:hypothetical protein